MEQQTNLEERLWDYIDGLASSEERTFIEKMLAEQNLWKEKYAELLEVHGMMKEHIQLDEPSMRFTQNVMEEIARLQIAPATKNYLNKKIIWGIGIFFIAMLAAILAYGFSQIQWNTGSSSGTSLPIDLDKVDFSVLYNNTYTNVFIMINIILGLVLLDMYLGKKKRESGMHQG